MKRTNTLFLFCITVIGILALVVPWTDVFSKHVADTIEKNLAVEIKNHFSP